MKSLANLALFLVVHLGFVEEGDRSGCKLTYVRLLKAMHQAGQKAKAVASRPKLLIFASLLRFFFF
jgi:hypothetical protein